jgi:hypothetical protein
MQSPKQVNKRFQILSDFPWGTSFLENEISISVSCLKNTTGILNDGCGGYLALQDI